MGKKEGKGHMPPSRIHSGGRASAGGGGRGTCHLPACIVGAGHLQMEGAGLEQHSPPGNRNDNRTVVSAARSSGWGVSCLLLGMETG